MHYRLRSLHILGVVGGTSPRQSGGREGGEGGAGGKSPRKTRRATALPDERVLCSVPEKERFDRSALSTNSFRQGRERGVWAACAPT